MKCDASAEKTRVLVANTQVQQPPVRHCRKLRVSARIAADIIIIAHIGT